MTHSQEIGYFDIWIKNGLKSGTSELNLGVKHLLQMALPKRLQNPKYPINIFELTNVSSKLSKLHESIIVASAANQTVSSQFVLKWNHVAVYFLEVKLEFSFFSFDRDLKPQKIFRWWWNFFFCVFPKLLNLFNAKKLGEFHLLIKNFLHDFLERLHEFLSKGSI